MHFGLAEFSKERVKEVLTELGIDERVRGEALNLEQFIEISNLL